MKKKELNAFKSKSISELKKLISGKNIEKVKVFGELKAGKEKNLKKLKMLRRDIAQMSTILRRLQFVKNMGKEAETEK